MPSSSLGRKLLSDGAYMFAARVANIALAALVSIITARLLGPAGRGVYALPTVDAGLVTSAFGGLTIATSFYMLNKGASRALVAAALKTALLFSVAGAVAVSIVAIVGKQAWVILPAALSLPASALIAVATGYWIGSNKIRRNNVISLSSSIAIFLLMVPLLTLVAPVPRLAIIAWVAGNAVAAVGATTWMLLHARGLPEGERVAFLPFVKYSVSVGITGFVTLLNYNIDIYIVAMLTTPADLGLYTIAVAGAETLLIFTQVAASVAMPDIGGLEAKESGALVARVARTNLAIALVLCALTALAAPWIVPLIYGAKFSAAVPTLRVLLIGALLLAPSSLISSFFTLKLGTPHIPLLMAAISAAVTAVVTVLLVPSMGIMGGAIGTVAGYGVGQAISMGLFMARSGTRLHQILVLQKSDVLAYRRVVGDIARRCAF